MKKICTMLACLIGLTMGANVAMAENMPPDEPQGPPPMGKYGKKPPRHVDLDKKLNLTEEQKAKMDKNRQASREKLKPIMQKMRENRSKMEELRDSNLSEAQKREKFEVLRKERHELRKQANVIREADMKYFESLLTDAQKKKFEKIKQERKKQMDKNRKNMKKGPRPPYME